MVFRSSREAAQIDRLRLSQIGTTVVEGLEHLEKDERHLPKVIRDALRDIRVDPTKYSEVYYYPFFRNYAVMLKRSVVNLAAHLRIGGTMLLFVRDTVRKNVLFPTGDLITRVLTSRECGLEQCYEERRIINNHIGFLRKSSTSGLYGLAQQEWWLGFTMRRNVTKNGRS